MLNSDLYKITKFLLKSFIFIGDIIMTIHCALLLTGILQYIAELIAGICVLGFIMLFTASYLLNFCNLYRCLLTHNFAVFCCINFHKQIGFGVLLTPIRWIMLCLGILFICLTLKQEIYDKRICNKTTQRIS